MDKLLLTPDEAALVLRIGRSKVYELLASRHSAASRSEPADASPRKHCGRTS
jgi:hypothetical protein